MPSLEVAYVWHATAHMLEVALGLERIGFELRQQIVWVKSALVISRSAYHWQHEPCWYAVKKGASAGWIGSRDQSTVWELASPKAIMAERRGTLRPSHPETPGMHGPPGAQPRRRGLGLLLAGSAARR